MAKRKVFSIGSSLSDGLEQTIAAAHNYSSDLRVEVVPLKKIEMDPENPRLLSLTLADLINGMSENDPQLAQKNSEIQSLQSLANSIQEQGIINPIMVYEFDGMYRLIAGERRTLASALAKKVDIQAKIMDGKPNELKIRVLQWIENIERSDLLLVEKMNNLEKIIDAFAQDKKISREDVSITDISQLIGCVKSHAINLKIVLDADIEIKDLIEKNQIRSIEKAAIISNIKSENLRKLALNECLKGATLKHLKGVLEQDKVKPKPVRMELMRRAGRPSTSVNFGTTPNLKVASIIIDSIISNPNFSGLGFKFSDEDVDNPKILSDTFKTIIKKLEHLHE